MYINWISHGNLEAGIILGGSLQMIALGWANIGAAVAPDAALASVASAIILALGGQGVKGVSSAIAIAIPLAVAGLFLTMVVRTVAVPIVHMMDTAAEKGDIRKIEMLHILAVCLQGIRIAIPADRSFIYSGANSSKLFRINAGVVNRRNGNWWWNGRSSWICACY